MAAIENEGSPKALKNRARKNSTRVDFTPMVDLGFLLITFFMLTTTMVHKTVMDITFPVDGEPMPISDKGVITLMPGANNRVFYYVGLNTENIKSVGYGKQELRKLLLDEKRKNTPKSNAQSELKILIKPTNESRYQNLIDIVDELNVCGINRYAITDITTEEIAMVGEGR